MSSHTRNPVAPRALPPRPNMEHLRNEAKQRHRLIRQTNPSAKLAEAQLIVAREYGFASWRELNAEVEKGVPVVASGADSSRLEPYVGIYLIVMDNGPDACLTITRKGTVLFVQITGGPRIALVEEAEDTFMFPGASLGYVFERTGGGHIPALVLTDVHGEHRMLKIDPAEAVAVEEALTASLNEQMQPRVEVEVTSDVLERVAGFYCKLPAPPLTITLEGGKLYAQLPGPKKGQLYPESDFKFFSKSVSAQFSAELDDGEVRAVMLHQNGRLFRFPRTTEAAVLAAAEPILRQVEDQQRSRVAIQADPTTLDLYMGDYQLITGTAITVTTEDKRLFIQLAGQKRYEVYAESDHKFFWKVVSAQITFVLSEEGLVTGAVLHQSGRDLPITRLEPSPSKAEAA